MKEHNSRIVYLLGRERLRPWLLMVVLAFFVGVMELIGALLIFVLLAAITGPGGDLSVPVLGDVRARFSTLSDEQFLLRTAVLVAAFFLLRAGITMAQSYLQHRLAQNAGVRLSTRLFRGYLNMPYAFHLQRNSAEFVRNVQHSVMQVVTLTFTPLVLLISETLLVMFLFVALLLVSGVVTILTVAVMGPTVFILVKAIKRTMRRIGVEQQETARETLQALQEGFQGVRDIKVLHREHFFESRFAVSRARTAKAVYTRSVLTEVPRVTTETMLVLFIVLFLVVAVVTNTPLADVLAVLATFGYVGVRLVPSLNRIVSNANNLQFALPAVDDLWSELSLLEERPVHDERPPAPVTFEHALTLDNVSFAYDDETRVLTDISFTVQPGESIGIVGSTGSGKSTLMDIMLGLLEPTSGTLTVDGDSIARSPREWQEKLGFVPQSTFLIDDALRRNVAFGLANDEIDETRLKVALELAQLDEFVGTLPDGVDTIVGERGVRLSGGQRQRVAIARALYRDPEVLFFDEATSALDNITEARLIEGIERLRGTRTIVMVAHRLTTVRRSDRILLLEGGRLVDSGTYEDLLARNATFQALSR